MCCFRAANPALTATQRGISQENYGVAAIASVLFWSLSQLDWDKKTISVNSGERASLFRAVVMGAILQ